MDTLEKLGSQLSQITMYDVKSMYNQAKNVVLNVSEMEAKVRDATNDDPWGASSTLMTDIAQGTFNYQQFNEIMPCIYSRFMEKEARQWRQIYKALQLLEYLIKHGSERVVDDARSHMSTIKMLRSFHYIDEKGKDQGINVRNRAREIVELLADLDKVRAERKKAKQNRSKYTGVGNDEISFSSGGSRYGGFGSDAYEGGSSGGAGGSGWSGGGVSSTSDFYRNHGESSSRSGGGGGSGGFRDTSRRQDFDEYDAGEDDDRKPTSQPVAQTRAPQTRRSLRTEPAPAPAPAPAPLFDLIGDFDGPISAPVAAPTPATNKALPAPISLDDEDDFGDFASGTTSPAPAPAPVKTAAPTSSLNVFDVLNQPTAQPVAPRAPAMSPTVSNPGGYGHFGGFGATSPPLAPTMSPTTSFGGVAKPATTPAAAPKPAGAAGFDDLWNMSLGSAAAKPATSTTGKTIKEMENEKAQAAMWGGGAKQPQQSQWGSFGGSTASNNAGGGDDLLL
ncbi:hypothetical protein BKA62DRAFT_709670 [Auriculariales sp. MPI-PUGE-AT-0066]|nr:hypothetical protein BKA62DRAFT_709670 [Auriculariales sp. MPI-PUGE-AT-0066]